MSRVDDALPQPNLTVLVQDDQRLSQFWANWFKELYRLFGYSNNHQADYVPTYSGLTIGAGSVTHSGVYFKLRKICYFSLKIDITGGNTSSVLGTTKINNFPYTIKQYGSFQVMNAATKAFIGNGFCNQSSNELYMPNWTTITDDIIISGFVFVDG